MFSAEEMQLKLGKIHNIDCLEFMRQVPDNYFDLVLTDPPYGIGFSSNPVRGSHEKKDWDSATPNNDVFNEIFRISKNQIIWGGNYFDLPPTKGFVIWDKDQPLEFTLAMYEYAWTSFDKPAKGLKYPVRLIGGDKFHPTMKPIELMNFCLRYAKVESGCKIFDPFAGSCTTAVAAESMGLEWCVCELEQDYCKIGQDRLKNIQVDLFGL